MLGVMVCYSLSTSINASGENIYETAKRLNVPLFLLPEKKSPASAFRSAMENFAKKNKFLLEDEEADDSFIRKSLYERMGAGKSYSIEFDKATHDIFVCNEDSTATNDRRLCEIKNRILEEYSNSFGRVMIKEIRTSIESAIDYFGGVKVRLTGGVVFIPTETYNLWRNYEKMLVGIGVSFLDVTLEDTESNRKAIWFAFNNYAERCIDDELIRLKMASETYNPLNKKTDIIISTIKKKELTITKANNLHERIDYLKRKGVRYDRRLQIAVPIVSFCDSILGALDGTYGNELENYY